MSDHSPLSNHAPPSLALLNEWLDDQGITRHPSLRMVHMVDGSGWTVEADQEVEIGAVCAFLYPFWIEL